MARNILAAINAHGVYMTAFTAPTADILKAADNALAPGSAAMFPSIGLYTPEGELLDVATAPEGEGYKRMPREAWADTKARDMRAEPDTWRALTRHVVLMEGK